MSNWLSVDLPSGNVAVGDFYKHLMPDLPGPIKMRQLMLWAVQKAATKHRLDAAFTENVIQALYTNKITTSWYQRPQNFASASVSALPSVNPFQVGPKNQELIDCIQLYERYSAKLLEELELWQNIQDTLFSQFTTWSTQTQLQMQEQAQQMLHNQPPPSLAGDLQQLTQWMNMLPSLV